MSVLSKFLNHSVRVPVVVMASVSVSAFLSACAVPQLQVPAALSHRSVSGEPFEQLQEEAFGAVGTGNSPKRLSVVNAPVPGGVTDTVVVGGGSVSGGGDGGAVSVNVDQMSIKTFTQFVFGNLLKKTVALDAKLAQRTDLISLRTDNPQTARQVAETAKLLLQAYGVSVTEFDSLVRVSPADSKGSDLPLLRRGRASAETPMALRPVFHLVELEATRSSEVMGWIKTMFGSKLELQDASNQNSILMSGAPENVSAALEMVRALDAPRMRGRIAKRLAPAFLSATELVTRLTDILSAQGYAVSGQNNPQSAASAILMVPVVSLNIVYVFTASQAVAEHVVKWAEEVDQVPVKSGSAGFLSYPVRYSDAQSLAKTMSDLIAAGTMAQPVAVASPGAVGTAPRAPGRVVVNSATNSLIIQGGTPDEHRQWRALLQELDRPVKSALIDVVVAELTLGTKEQLGVEWNMKDQMVSGGSISGGTLGGLGLGTGGLGLSFLNGVGQVRGMLNFLGSSSKARILSSPKLLARNAETATIQVGQEVPIITSQQSATVATGVTTTGVLQTIQYRSTGVILRVKPIILAGGRLDLEVAQEVSSAAQTTTGVSTSPTFSSRKVDTKLSLRDGGTVMLAGLISRDLNDGNSGIPGLKDIPGLGNLFKNQNESSTRTELIIMITAHILNDDFESEAITDSFRKSLEQWLPQPNEAAVSQLKVGNAALPTGERIPSSVAGSSEVIRPFTPHANALVTPLQLDPPVIEVPPVSRKQPITIGSAAGTPIANSLSSAAVKNNESLLKTADDKASLHPSGVLDKGTQERQVTDQALIDELRRAIGK